MPQFKVLFICFVGSEECNGIWLFLEKRINFPYYHYKNIRIDCRWIETL